MSEYVIPKFTNKGDIRRRFLFISKEMQDRIVSLISASPIGLTAEELADMMGVKPKTCTVRLCHVSQAGLIQLVGPRGRGARWAVKSNAKAAEAEVKRLSDELKANRYLKQREYRARKRAQALDKLEVPAIKQVIVSADKAKPIKKLGPASVWELAEA